MPKRGVDDVEVVNLTRQSSGNGIKSRSGRVVKPKIYTDYDGIHLGETSFPDSIDEYPAPAYSDDEDDSRGTSSDVSFGSRGHRTSSLQPKSTQRTHTIPSIPTATIPRQPRAGGSVHGGGGIFKAAAVEVLRQERRLMSTGEIARAAINRGLVICTGKTPEATMASALYTDVKRREEFSIFIRPSEGMFGLREWLDPNQGVHVGGVAPHPSFHNKTTTNTTTTTTTNTNIITTNTATTNTTAIINSNNNNKSAATLTGINHAFTTAAAAATPPLSNAYTHASPTASTDRLMELLDAAEEINKATATMETPATADSDLTDTTANGTVGCGDILGDKDKEAMAMKKGVMTIMPIATTPIHIDDDLDTNKENKNKGNTTITTATTITTVLTTPPTECTTSSKTPGVFKKESISAHHAHPHHRLSLDTGTGTGMAVPTNGVDAITPMTTTPPMPTIPTTTTTTHSIVAQEAIRAAEAAVDRLTKHYGLGHTEVNKGYLTLARLYTFDLPQSSKQLAETAVLQAQDAIHYSKNNTSLHSSTAADALDASFHDEEDSSFVAIMNRLQEEAREREESQNMRLHAVHSAIMNALTSFYASNSGHWKLQQGSVSMGSTGDGVELMNGGAVVTPFSVMQHIAE